MPSGNTAAYEPAKGAKLSSEGFVMFVENIRDMITHSLHHTPNKLAIFRSVASFGTFQSFKRVGWSGVEPLKVSKHLRRGRDRNHLRSV